MLKPLLASLALATAPVAALAQITTPGQWTVSGSPGGCMANAASPQGTVVSILAGEGQSNLLVLVQNRRWGELEDGGKHRIAVQFDGSGSYQFDAVARTDLDADGPGLLFVVPASEANGVKFIADVASASGIALDSDGEALDRLPLKGGDRAMTSLAQCMSKLWSGRDGEAAEAATVTAAAGPAVKL